MNENKDLLLKYLSMALPYGVICRQSTVSVDGEPFTIDRYASIIQLEKCLSLDDIEVPFKPYLHSMSSMTEKEFAELHNICPHSAFNQTNVHNWIVGLNGSDSGRITHIDEMCTLIQWLLKHHFDFMGLIPKELAIEVTKKNNPYKN